MRNGYGPGTLDEFPAAHSQVLFVILSVRSVWGYISTAMHLRSCSHGVQGLQSEAAAKKGSNY